MNATRKSLLIALISTVLFAPVAHARQGADDGIGHVRQEDRQADRREDRQLDRRMRSQDDTVSGTHLHKKKHKRNRRGRGR